MRAETRDVVWVDGKLLKVDAEWLIRNINDGGLGQRIWTIRTGSSSQEVDAPGFVIVIDGKRTPVGVQDDGVWKINGFKQNLRPFKEELASGYDTEKTVYARVYNALVNTAMSRGGLAQRASGDDKLSELARLIGNALGSVGSPAGIYDENGPVSDVTSRGSALRNAAGSGMRPWVISRGNNWDLKPGDIVSENTPKKVIDRWVKNGAVFNIGYVQNWTLERHYNSIVLEPKAYEKKWPDLHADGIQAITSKKATEASLARTDRGLSDQRWRFWLGNVGLTTTLALGTIGVAYLYNSRPGALIDQINAKGNSLTTLYKAQGTLSKEVEPLRQAVLQSRKPTGEIAKKFVEAQGKRVDNLVERIKVLDERRQLYIESAKSARLPFIDRRLNILQDPAAQDLTAIETAANQIVAINAETTSTLQTAGQNLDVRVNQGQISVNQAQQDVAQQKALINTLASNIGNQSREVETVRRSLVTAQGALEQQKAQLLNAAQNQWRSELAGKLADPGRLETRADGWVLYPAIDLVSNESITIDERNRRTDVRVADTNKLIDEKTTAYRNQVTVTQRLVDAAERKLSELNVQLIEAQAKLNELEQKLEQQEQRKPK